ncbi:hypothetical protein ACO0QE_001338 [Hanseniaspora vineae]
MKATLVRGALFLFIIACFSAFNYSRLPLNNSYSKSLEFQVRSDELKDKWAKRRRSRKISAQDVKPSSNTYVDGFDEARHMDKKGDGSLVFKMSSRLPVEWKPKFNDSYLEFLHKDHLDIHEFNNFNFELDDWLFYVTAYHFQIRLPEVLTLFDTPESPYFSYTVYKPPFVENINNTKAQSCILMLVRNLELEGALRTIRRLEDRFNQDHKYDWVFLNDEPFTLDFITATSAMCSSSKIKYGMIPRELWSVVPGHIDMDEANRRMESMEAQGVLYGGSLSYRHMCRFQSMSFYKHPAVLEYRYYMRTEPDVDYFCDFNEYDPFKVMELKGKKYGFVISMYEYEDTIPTLWESVEEFMEDTSVSEGTDEFVVGDGFQFLTDDQLISSGNPNEMRNTQKVVDTLNGDYNLCHFWSNFEVGDMDGFYRTSRYNSLMNFLNLEKNGFYYERWGDAPVHTIAAMLFLNKSEIIHFDTLGYFHAPFGTCPLSENIRLQQRCFCDAENEYNIDIEPYSCLMKWWKNGDGKRFLV